MDAGLPPSPDLRERASALARLLAGVYGAEAGDGRHPLPDGELATRLRAPVPEGIPVVDWAAVRLGEQEALGPVQRGLLTLAEDILNGLLEGPAFHARLADRLQPARGALAGAALGAGGWIVNPGHPVRELLQTLQQGACGWYPGLGPATDSARDRLLAWVPDAFAPGTDWALLTRRFVQAQAAEAQRLRRLEERVAEAERGQLRARRARQLAARVLNQNMAGIALPPAVIAALREDWFPAMQWALLNEGEHGALWQRVRRLTGSWRWTLQAEAAGEDARQKLVRVIGQAAEDLEAVAPRVFRDAAAGERLAAAIETVHVAALRHQPLPREVFPPVDDGDAFPQGAAEVSATLLDAVTRLQPGTWFTCREDAEVRRFRLLLRQDDTRQLVFTNLLGARAATMSFEAFALKLAGGDAQALADTPDIGAAVAAAQAALADRVQAAQQTRMAQLQAARARAAAEARERELARQKALADAQALEATRREARLKAEEALQAATRAAEDEARQRTQRARLLASSLTVGTWLDCRAADGTRLRRKLAVVLAASGKYILTDADGAGRLEYTRDTFIQALAEGHITTLQDDRRLADALDRVVDSRRQAPGEPTP